MEMLYGYTVCYQKLTMGLSLLCHVFATIFNFLGILGGKHIDTDFVKLMRNYHSKQTTKVFIDEVQIMFQCCGGNSFKDWYTLEWSREANKTSLRLEIVCIKLA